MSPYPIRFKVAATTLLTLFLMGVGTVNLIERESLVVVWDGVFWQETSRGLRISEVSHDSPAHSAGLSWGEILDSVNGRRVENLGELRNLLERLGPNAVATYRVENPATGSRREVALMLASRPLLAPLDGLRILLAFLHLAIGLFVLLRRRVAPRAFHFYLICLTAFVVYLYSATGSWTGIDRTVYGLSIWAPLILPALFLHFCMRFPVDHVEGKSRAFFVYVPTIVLGLIQTLWVLGRLADFGLPRTAHAYEFLNRADLAFLALGFLAGGILLWRRRVEANDLTVQQQMKWVSYGTLAGIVPLSLIYVVPVLLGAHPNFPMELSMLSLSFIPLSFAYAIIHYRLLDVEIIVRRGAAYFMASSLLLALYLALVLIVGKTLEWIAPDADFVVIAIGALAISLLFAPLRNRIQARLDRFFYKEQFDERASLLDFARMLNNEISLGRLSRSILERVSKTFHIQKSALLLADPYHPGFFRLTDELGLEDIAIADSLLFREDEVLAQEHPNGLPHVAGVNCLHLTRPVLSERGLHYLQELNLRGRRIGMIALGQLPQNEHFSTEDLDLLGALAGYAAIALENANLYRSLEIKALELERLRIYTENIIESINVSVLVLDLEGRVTACNRAFENLYHATRDQILNGYVNQVFPPDVVASIQKATGTTGWQLKGPGNIYKLYLENRRGERLIVNMSIIPLVDLSDQTIGSVIVMDDITMKVRLEDQLLQAEKLSSIGLLAAGIAHEVNTPITGISSYTQILLKEMSDGDTRKPILEEIEKQTFRAAEIVNGLLNFSRMNGSEYADLDINALLKESLTLLDHQMKKGHIQVAARLAENLPRVYGNTGKLQQVFINLFMNARDAMPSGGELQISTSMNEKMVIVDVKDTGCGISEENIKRIYDPFFTTKTTGKGTGLGLAVTYGILQEHGGRIFVDSQTGRGTHFRVKLPTREVL